jgi:hypothetical protein
MIQTTFLGNLQRPVCQTLTGSTGTRIGSVANNATILAAFAITNPTASGVTCSLYWYDASTSTARRIWLGTVPAGVSDQVDIIPVKLSKGDEIQVVGANLVEVVLVYSTPSATG